MSGHQCHTYALILCREQERSGAPLHRIKKTGKSAKAGVSAQRSSRGVPLSRRSTFTSLSNTHPRHAQFNLLLRLRIHRRPHQHRNLHSQRSTTAHGQVQARKIRAIALRPAHAGTTHCSTRRRSLRRRSRHTVVFYPPCQRTRESCHSGRAFALVSSHDRYTTNRLTYVKESPASSNDRGLRTTALPSPPRRLVRMDNRI